MYYVVGTNERGEPEEFLTRPLITREVAEGVLAEEERCGRYAAFPGRLRILCDVEELDVIIERAEAGAFNE